MRQLHTEGMPCGAGHLLELETAAWKDHRRFRVLAVDQGRLAFVDLYYVTPSRRTFAGGRTAGQTGIVGVHSDLRGEPHE